MVIELAELESAVSVPRTMSSITTKMLISLEVILACLLRDVWFIFSAFDLLPFDVPPVMRVQVVEIGEFGRSAIWTEGCTGQANNHISFGKPKF